MTLLTDRWVAAVIVLIAAAILAAALITWWLQRERRTITNRAIDLYSHDRADEVQPPNTLTRLAQAGHAHAIVSELTRDPDPEPEHPYMRSPQSGAGNCICGAAERHRRHPHEFLPAMNDPQRCVCALPREAKCHRQADEVQPPQEET